VQAISTYNRAFDFGSMRDKVNVLLLISQHSMELGRWVDVDTAINKLASMGVDDAVCVSACAPPPGPCVCACACALRVVCAFAIGFPLLGLLIKCGFQCVKFAVFCSAVLRSVVLFAVSCSAAVRLCLEHSRVVRVCPLLCVNWAGW
jgi:hypothetical protein